MSNEATVKTESKQKTPVESAADAQASKAAKIKADVSAEILAIVDARRAYHAALSKTGPLGLEMLAVKLGQSVDNKFGYPAHAEYADFVNVAVLQKTDHTSYDRLARIARNAIGTNPDAKALSKDDVANAQEKFLTGTSKRSGNGDKSAASVKIKAPKAFDVALGGN